MEIELKKEDEKMSREKNPNKKHSPGNNKDSEVAGSKKSKK
ncbi:hypothetical protein PAAL109150_24750 [Paenibacillus alkaliterrae]